MGILFVGLAVRMLVVELAEVVDGWSWHNGMVDNKPELGLGCFGRLVVRKEKGRMRSIVGVGEAIVWCCLLLWVLFVAKAGWIPDPFSIVLEEYEAVFGAMIIFTPMEHAIWRSECVWASTMTVTVIWCSASLIVLSESQIRGPCVSFLGGWHKILLPVFWWPVANRVNAMHRLGVVALTVIVARSPWGLFWF
jgi:hypothetical protein